VRDVGESSSESEPETSPDISSPDIVSVVCSPSEKQFIEAVFHDGETLDAYIDAITERGLTEDVRAILDG
jgi:hypothetical protein